MDAAEVAGNPHWYEPRTLPAIIAQAGKKQHGKIVVRREWSPLSRLIGQSTYKATPPS